MGDSVLERNLCFVDTPGYGNKTSVGGGFVGQLQLANTLSAWNLLPQSLIILNLISKELPILQG